MENSGLNTSSDMSVNKWHVGEQIFIFKWTNLFNKYDMHSFMFAV